MDRDAFDRIRQKLKSRPVVDVPEIDSKDKIPASVLVPFAYHDRILSILFTRRSNQLASHRGQVSFPGGMKESADLDLLAAALRETKEEIGIGPENIDVLGRLEPIKSHTGLMIYPFAGFIRDLNGLQNNMDEVERIFCIPYDWLRSSENLFQEDYQRSTGEVHKVWTFKAYEGEKIWGITAEITRQLIQFLG